MLEWYRPGWDHIQLIEEVQALLQHVLKCGSAPIVTYQSLFEKEYNINPHLASLNELKEIAIARGWAESKTDLDRAAWLDLLLTHGLEPHLNFTVVTDYPGFQASLSKTRSVDGHYEVAERFEFYYQGVELANGYHELTCPNQQRERFVSDLKIREEKALTALPIDENLLAALDHGLPESAGVALGIDRLFLLQQKQNRLADVLPFSWQNA
jgi:lysyl-tRNA synthetase class 2